MRKHHLQWAFKAVLVFSLVITLPQCAEFKDRARHLLERTGAHDSDPATASVTARSLNLRKGPSTQAAVLAVLEKGDRVRVEAQEGLWLRVVTRNGRKGWVHRKYVTGFQGLAPEATGLAASNSAAQPTLEGSRPSHAGASETAGKGEGAVLFEDGEPLKPDRLPAVSEPPVETAGPLFEDEPVKPPGPPSTTGAPFPAETSPLFEDAPVADAKAPAPVDSPRPAPDPQLFEDPPDKEAHPAPLTEPSDPSREKAPDQEATGEFVKGPWAEAAGGTRIQYCILRNLPSLQFRQIQVMVTEEAVKADDGSVTVRVRREWEEGGESKSDETRERRARLVQSAELKAFMDRFGPKTGEETLTVGGKAVRCEIHESLQTGQIETLSGETRTVHAVFYTHLSKEVPGWQVRVRVKSAQVDEVKWQLLDYRP